MLFVATVLLASFQDPPLAEETRFDPVGIALHLPGGWTPVKVEAPSLVKVQAPPGKLSGGDFLVARVESDEPSTTRIFAAGMIDWHQKNFPGIELVGQDDLDVAGVPARRLHFRWKDLSVWKICLARTPLILISIDLTCETKEEAQGKALAAALAATVRFYPPVAPVEAREAEERGLAVTRGAKLPDSVLGDLTYVLLVADKPIGRWKRTLRAAKVRGKDGYEIESLLAMPDGKEGMRTDTIKGGFLLDGSFQRMETERITESKEHVKKTYRSLAVIDQGKFTATRVIDGENGDAAVDLPPGTYLNDFADVARSALVLAGKNTYAVRRIDPFTNLPSLEILEVAEPERIKVGAADRPMIVVLAKVDDRRHLVYRFEIDGRWESARLPGVKVEIRRCTTEEYEKVK